MTGTGFWTVPADRMTTGSGTRTELTVVRPPVTVDAGALPPNDTVAALEFARSLDMIDEVLEDLQSRVRQADTPFLDLRGVQVEGRVKVRRRVWWR
ncbi:DUF6333 family protein [Streptomyces sp. NPDC003236]